MIQRRRWLAHLLLSTGIGQALKQGNHDHQDGPVPKIGKNGTNPLRLVEMIGDAGGLIWGLCQLDDE